MEWTNEQIETLQSMAADGHSAGIIAAQIGKSRNAVIGRADRHQIELRGGGRTKPRGFSAYSPEAKQRHAEAQRRTHARYKALGRPHPAVAASLAARAEKKAPPPQQTDTVLVTMEASAVVAGITAILDLEPHHCRWPVGDPRAAGFGWCGGAAIPGRSYCAGHAARASRSAEAPRSAPFVFDRRTIGSRAVVLGGPAVGLNAGAELHDAVR